MAGCVAPPLDFQNMRSPGPHATLQGVQWVSSEARTRSQIHQIVITDPLAIPEEHPPPQVLRSRYSAQFSDIVFEIGGIREALEVVGGSEDFQQYSFQ